MTATSLFMGMIFGSIGVGYLVYGKKQQKGTALGVGLALCVLPYFVPNVLLLLILGALLMAIPWYVRY